MRRVSRYCKEIPGFAATVSETTKATAHARRPEARRWRAVRPLPFPPLGWSSGNAVRKMAVRCSWYQSTQDTTACRLLTSLGVAEKWLMGSGSGGRCNFESWYYRYNTTSSEAPKPSVHQIKAVKRALEVDRCKIIRSTSTVRITNGQQSEYNLRRVYTCQGPIGRLNSTCVVLPPGANQL